MIDIINKSECTGCTACKNICPHSAIDMFEDHEGFRYPHVNLNSCVNCGVCNIICPLPKRDAVLKDSNVLNAYVAHYKNNDNIWYESSSGGAFTAITNYIFDNNGIVYGAVYDDNWNVYHTSSHDSEDAIKFRGSKYVQSNLNDVFKSIKTELNNGRLVLFSGTPCQVAGLNAFLVKPYPNLLTIDLLCHCVPSPRVFKDYINYIQSKYKKKIIKINMKDKTLGWNNFQTMRLYFEDGTSIFNIEDTRLWETIFYSYTAIRPSCHSCRFSNLNRVGDITIGDYWGVENFHPQYYHHNGASIILVNSSKGKSIFPVFSKYLQYEETDPIKALPSSLVYTTTPHPNRTSFWKDYDRLSFYTLCKKYFGIGCYNKAKKYIRRLVSYIKNHI